MSPPGWTRRREPRARPSHCAVALSMLASASCASVHPSETITLATPAGHVTSVDRLTISYEVGGLRVIQRPSYANDVFAANLYFIGGVQELTPSIAGIEPLALRAAEYGSARYPRMMSRIALAATGSRIVVEPGSDWTLYGLRGVIAEFDSTWAVFADRVVHPSLDPTSVALVRSQLIREARERRESPDGAVTWLAESLAFVGHPYALSPAGDEQSLAALSPNAVREFVTSTFVTSRMLLVIVGNVTREQVERDLEASLAHLPRGSYAWHPPPAAPLHRTSVAVIDRPLPTNYLLGLFHGPAVTSPDYAPFEIATQMLSTRLNQAIRVDRALSYAAYAPYTDDALATGGIYVSTDTPDQVVPLIEDAIEHCRRKWESQSFVDRFVEFYITEYLMANETNEAQAASLARAQIYLGDYRQAARTMALLRQVNPGDLLRVSRKYMHDIRFAYLGSRDRIADVGFSGI